MSLGVLKLNLFLYKFQRAKLLLFSDIRNFFIHFLHISKKITTFVA